MNGKITLLFTGVGKPCHSHEFLTWQISCNAMGDKKYREQFWINSWISLYVDTMFHVLVLLEYNEFPGPTDLFYFYIHL